MQKFFLKIENSAHGYTLSEIMMVVIMVGIIASLAFPQYGVILEKSRAQEGNQTLLAILAAQKRFAVESGGAYTNNLADLDVTFRQSAYFANPTVSNNPLSLGSVVRTGSYTLAINSNGLISCTGGPAGLCARMGY